MFPEEFHGQLFIAEHGSWNRSKKIGYRVMLVTFEDGEPDEYEPFASGWLKGGKVGGRDAVGRKDRGSGLAQANQLGRGLTRRIETSGAGGRRFVQGREQARGDGLRK